jgi:hypothetical protein
MQTLLAMTLLFLGSGMVRGADSAPNLTVLEPVTRTLFHDPILRLHAVASDDTGPAKVRLYRVPLDLSTGRSGTPILIALGTNQVDTIFNVGPFSGQILQFQFTATDSALQEATVFISGEVSTNAALTKVLTVGGRIQTITPDAILFQTDQQSSPSTSNNFLIKENRHEGSTQKIASITNANDIIYAAFPTPTGAIYMQGGFDKKSIVESDGAQFAILDEKPISLRGSGHYALWENESSALILRDLLLRTNVTISTNASDGAIVVGNGDVVYQDQATRRIFRYSNAVATPITPASQQYIPLQADAINVVAWAIPTPASGVSGLVLITPAGQIILDEQFNGSTAPQLVDGYIAFEKTAASGKSQIWERHPDGSQIALTSPNINSSLIQLGSEGQVLYSSGIRYYIRPGSEPLPLDSSIVDVTYGNLTVGFFDGELSVLAGSSLFRLNPYSVDPRTSLPHMAGAGWQIGVSGQVGQTYAVQQSNDLINWADLTSGAFSDGSEIAVPVSMNGTNDFFRVVYR